MFKKLRCFVFGHRWTFPNGEPGNIAAERRCECGAGWSAVAWPRGEGTGHDGLEMPKAGWPELQLPTGWSPCDEFGNIRITKLKVQAGDVVVLNLVRHLDAETVDHLRKWAESAFDGVKVLVLDPGITLEVVRPEASAT